MPKSTVACGHTAEWMCPGCIRCTMCCRCTVDSIEKTEVMHVNSKAGQNLMLNYWRSKRAEAESHTSK